MPGVNLTPRPTPKFYSHQQTFSTKKERERAGGGTPRDCLPPKPPVKSAPPISRIYLQRPVLKAQLVSFLPEQQTGCLTNYNQQSEELYFDQCFEVHSKLGSGSFGEVFKVRSKDDGNFYAVKRSRDKFRGESDRCRKLEEVAKHEKLKKHENCVRFYKAWEERQHLYIQTELCQASLTDYSELQHDISEKLVWNYLVDLLLAVKHLHDHDLIHMDIKPDNIFIGEDGLAKLGDFGLVIDIVTGGNIQEAQDGDCKYMAPELLEGRVGKAADIFSLGITILELASDLDLPRGGEGWHQLRTNQIPTQFLKGKSSDLLAIISSMMTMDPNCRPSVNSILENNIIQKVLRRRRCQIIFNKTMRKMVEMFRYFLTVVTSLWLLVTYPLHYLIPDKLCTPETIDTTHPPEWDHSFSDEDICGVDDSINISNNSLGVPLDSSTSSEPDLLQQQNLFLVPSIPPVRCYTTPGLLRHKPKLFTPKNSSPIRSVDLSDSSWNASYDSPNNSFHDDEEYDFKMKTNIGPKNLIKVFEEASTEED
ncbi:membrane-associated tyrosine- and threonine-specific cdc2-inhibitory kinase-like [Tubulanus polymorphus]|uniref:membrane-associated tyrosine- and threonine-specific cdc2-inhibitory kinase-like n=1 Tax=Tubulanus polymorphus TaxID=672921 RepID=UPI003DA31011